MSKTNQQQWNGLTNDQVEQSRARHGPNRLTPPPRMNAWLQFLEKFKDPVIRILIIAAVIATGVGIVHGDYIEGIGILIAILLSTGLAFWNERQAAKEFDLLNQVTDEVLVKVIRNGQVGALPRTELVVGDIVLIEQGEEIPADGHLLEGVNLSVDESRLTGESQPVEKHTASAAAAHPDHAGSYASDHLLRGTLVADGHGVLEITAVGDHTEIGKTARAAAEMTGDVTPLTRQLERLSKLIGVCGLSFALLTFVGMILRGIFTWQMDARTGQPMLNALGQPMRELELSARQWYFTGILFVSVMLLLMRVWLPMVFDGLEMLGRRIERPSWLQRDSWKDWLVTLAASVSFFGVGLGLGWWLGWIGASPSQWLPAGQPELGIPSAAEKFLQYFMIAVTIIVVAVPEGLAMSVTLSLAYSMRRMAAANNLVRKMHACETIGAATVICSDKTGTLTKNEMQVQEVHFPALPGQSLAEAAVGGLIAESMSVNSTAHLQQKDNEVRAIGNPTEGAMLLWLHGQKVNYSQQRERFTIWKQWTFSTERKFMATLGQAPGMARGILHVKGAPEIVLQRCTRVLEQQGETALSEPARQGYLSQLQSYQQRGMRVLGFAFDPKPEAHAAEQPVQDVAIDLVWLGFIAIADPIREEVPAAVEACRRAGIDVKVVTGDNAATAKEIARQAGLLCDAAGEDGVITGPDFQLLDHEAASREALKLKVIARARPMDKMRLVRLLKEQHQVVAVTGDGTNDAPALNYADVGLAMGRTGTAVAKEASDIILLDDSFSSIVNAILWGRSLYQNIQRFLCFQLTINLSALTIALLGPYLGVAMPLTVMQMLWVNLIMDTFAALALATEPPDWQVMKKPPRNPQAFIITPTMARWIFVTAMVFVVFLIGLLLYFRQGQVLDYDWARKNQQTDVLRSLSMFFTIYVMLQFWNLFNARRIGTHRSIFEELLVNRSFWLIAGVILVGQFIITQYGGITFSTYPLTGQEWLAIVAGTSVVLWGGEIVRWLRRRQLSKLPDAADV